MEVEVAYFGRVAAHRDAEGAREPEVAQLQLVVLRKCTRTRRINHMLSLRC